MSCEPPSGRELAMGRHGYLAAVAAVVISAPPAWPGPLHDAARGGDLAQVQKLRDSGADTEDRDGTNETPLISAALASHADVVADLIKRGADVMARNDRGLTA